MIGSWILEEINKIGKPILTVTNMNSYHAMCAKCGNELRLFVEGRNDISVLWIEPCLTCCDEIMSTPDLGKDRLYNDADKQAGGK
jgi:hypothetical protein